MVSRSTERSSKSNSRGRQSKGKSSETPRKGSKSRQAFSGNSGCSLFGGPGVNDVSREREKKNKETDSPRAHSKTRNQLLSLETQISDVKKSLLLSNEELYFSNDYVKLKLDYANKLADEGRFPEALQEIIDLFVSKYNANKSMSSDSQNDDEDEQWNKSGENRIGEISNQNEILTPAS